MNSNASAYFFALTPSELRLGSELNELEAGEEIADLKSGSFGSVGTMSAIVADARAKVVANRAGRGLFRVGGAHGVTPLLDSALGLQYQHEYFPRAHEAGEFAEKGSLLVNCIKTRGFAVRENHGLDGNDAKTCLVNAGENFALLAARDGVRLDDCESAFDCHEEILR
jgi:hypothetical protein